MKLILSNSKVHSVDYAVRAIRAANPALSFDEANALAAKVHLNGRATILKASRAACRIGARAVRSMGGDQSAASILGSQPGYGEVDWTAPMKTRIVA